MRLTARGWAVLAVVVAAIAMSWQYGPRALNAVVTPLVVLLVAGVVTTLRAGRPQVRRSTVSEGFVGDTRTVTVTVESERTLSATIDDTLDDGVTAIDSIGAVTIDGTTAFDYAISLDDRGEYRIGPLSIVVVDLFGLFERRFRYEETVSVVVYPPIYDLGSRANRDLTALATATGETDRTEFDHLREYNRGDSLRDVNWKAAAKRPDDDLIVTEYADDGVDSVVVAGECTPARADELAAAVASLVTALLEADVHVGLSLPDAHSRPATGDDHRHELLRALAVFEGGDLIDDDRAGADVLVQADSDSVQVVLGERTIPFERVRATDRDEGEPRSDPDSGSRSSSSLTDGFDTTEDTHPTEAPP